MKRERTSEQIQADKERMAMVRAAREAKKEAPAAPSPQPEIVSPPVATLPEPAASESSKPPQDYEVVGAKIHVDTSEVTSMLESIKEDSEVEIYNPLKQGFRVIFPISVYQPAELTADAKDAAAKTGAAFTKDMGQSVNNIIKDMVLPPESTIRLPGKVAARAVYQLRNYLMRMDKDNYADVADPVARRRYEEQIVVKISSALDRVGVVDHAAEIDHKIAELNQSGR